MPPATTDEGGRRRRWGGRCGGWASPGGETLGEGTHSSSWSLASGGGRDALREPNGDDERRHRLGRGSEAGRGNGGLPL